MTVPAPEALEGKSLGEAALLWATSGWSVFPIVPRGKTPYGKGEFCSRADDHGCGFLCATTDPMAIGLWWSLHPNSNIGLTSPDAFVVDEDRLGALVDANVKLPRCPYQVTGRAGGGRHFFLHAPDGWEGLAGDSVKVTYRVPAVEVKGYGKGYVVAAPSIHASGARYAVELGGWVPEVSDAVIRKLVNVEHVGDTSAFITVGAGGYEIPESIASGDRYKSIVRYTAHLYNREVPIEDMWPLVLMRLAPHFAERKPEHEIRGDFERAIKDLPKRLGAPKGGRPSPAATPIPTSLDDAPLTEFDSRPVEWVWPGWLPRGVVTVMDGNPGVSKSTLVADLVARLTRGTEWPDGTPVGGPTRAMWITTEDDPGRVLRPRIEAAGGDPSMVLFVRSEVVFPAARTAFQELLVRRAAEPLGLRFVVLDPLFSHIEASVRTIADAEMRRGVMNPLNEAAEAADLSVLVVRHFSKDTAASPINRGAGSLGGIVGAARALWSVTTDPEDESGDAKVVGVSKLNYARMPPGLRYRVVDRLPPGWVSGSVSGIEWLGQVSGSFASILAETPSSREAQPVLAQLLEVGPMNAEAVYGQMRSKGFGRDATRSAKNRIGVLVTKSGLKGGWTWSLPTESDDTTSNLSPIRLVSSNRLEPDSSDDSSDSSASRAGAPPRAGRDHHATPSDSSKSRKSWHTAGFPRADARVREGECRECHRILELDTIGRLVPHYLDGATDPCLGSAAAPIKEEA
jgi:AAA domain/Bifunctional DNA primase/polymerase, N-terminal